MEPMHMEMSGEPEEAYEVTAEDALMYAADVTGNLHYILNLHPVLGYAS